MTSGKQNYSISQTHSFGFYDTEYYSQLIKVIGKFAEDLDVFLGELLPIVIQMVRIIKRKLLTNK